MNANTIKSIHNTSTKVFINLSKNVQAMNVLIVRNLLSKTNEIWIAFHDCKAILDEIMKIRTRMNLC